MFGVEKVGAGKAALCRIVREGLIHPGSFSTKSTIGEGFQVTEAEIRTAKWPDDAGEFYGLRIHEGHVAVEAPQECRMIAGDIVDQLVGGEKWRIPACVIPKAVAQPRTLGKPSRELSDALFKLGLAVGGAKVHADERTDADEEVHVGVVEAGQ